MLPSSTEPSSVNGVSVIGSTPVRAVTGNYPADGSGGRWLGSRRGSHRHRSRPAGTVPTPALQRRGRPSERRAMPVQRYAVVGGGIIGTAVARRLLVQRPDAVVTVLEKEDRLAAHQTGRNSGAVDAGLHHAPRPLQATLGRRGGFLPREVCAGK